MEDALELVSGRDFELLVAAILRLFVEAPAHESRAVTEPRALHVVVRDLHHALRPQRLPAQVLAAIPAAARAGHALIRLRFRPVAPRMIAQRIDAQRRELFDQLLALRRGERRRHADVLQAPVIVVEAEEERADHRAGTVLVPAEAGDDAIGGARMFDLDHRPLARAVRRVEALRHHAVQSRAFEAIEPVGRDVAFERRRREMQGRLRFGERFLQPLAARGERRLAQIVVIDRQQIPPDERCRRLLREQLHARRRGMNPQQQRFEIETVRSGDDDLAVDHAALRQHRRERLDELRKVAVQRLQIAALQQELVFIAKHQRAEAVPFRLEEPAVAFGQRIGGGGEHRFERRIEWQVHHTMMTTFPRVCPSPTYASAFPASFNVYRCSITGASLPPSMRLAMNARSSAFFFATNILTWDRNSVCTKRNSSPKTEFAAPPMMMYRPPGISTRW